jgi:hypothetical protein
MAHSGVITQLWGVLEHQRDEFNSAFGNLAQKTPKDKELGFKNILDGAWQLSDHPTGFEEVGRPIWLSTTHLKDNRYILCVSGGNQREGV